MRRDRYEAVGLCKVKFVRSLLVLQNNGQVTNVAEAEVMCSLTEYNYCVVVLGRLLKRKHTQGQSSNLLNSTICSVVTPL